MKLRKVLSWIEGFLKEDDGTEPSFDPVHLAGTLVVCMTAAGGLYWLLWTLLVFEGGIFPKIPAALAVLMTGRTLRDYGYDPRTASMGVFEGWAGNVTALIFLLLLLAALMSVYQKAAKRRP